MLHGVLAGNDKMAYLGKQVVSHVAFGNLQVQQSPAMQCLQVLTLTQEPTITKQSSQHKRQSMLHASMQNQHCVSMECWVGVHGKPRQEMHPLEQHNCAPEAG